MSLAVLTWDALAHGCDSGAVKHEPRSILKAASKVCQHSTMLVHWQQYLQHCLKEACLSFQEHKAPEKPSLESL